MKASLIQLPLHVPHIVNKQLLSVLISTMPKYQARDFLSLLKFTGFPTIYITRYTKYMCIESNSPNLMLYHIMRDDYNKIKNIHIHARLKTD